MKFEGGVHRVQRVPKTEKQGRIHTSTMTVAILPQPTEVRHQSLLLGLLGPAQCLVPRVTTHFTELNISFYHLAFIMYFEGFLRILS